jgi:hypothetical protein
MEYNGKKILAKPNGNTYDIIEALINITPQAIEQVKPKIKTIMKTTIETRKADFAISLTESVNKSTATINCEVTLFYVFNEIKLDFLSFIFTYATDKTRSQLYDLVLLVDKHYNDEIKPTNFNNLIVWKLYNIAKDNSKNKTL